MLQLRSAFSQLHKFVGNCKRNEFRMAFTIRYFLLFYHQKHTFFVISLHYWYELILDTTYKTAML